MPSTYTESFSYPFPFWLCLLGMAALGAYFIAKREEGWGFPALAVLGTVAVWYIVDAFYNDYAGYLLAIGADSLDAAWWEVGLFLAAFGILVRPVHLAINRKHLGRQSNWIRLMQTGNWQSDALQDQVDVACRLLAIAWILLMGVAIVRVDFDFAGLFLPFLGNKAEAWERGRVGEGFDFLLSFAGYFQITLTAIFGVIAAIASRPKTRILALVIFGLSAPYFLLARARNTIIAAVVPGFLAFAFLRLRGGLVIRGLVIAAGFLAMNHWLKFVIDAREHQMNVAYAFSIGRFLHIGQDESSDNVEDIEIFTENKPDLVKHQGLNMFQELGWINYFIKTGSYMPNWGRRYFADLVNPIPRSIWHGKPLIGMDYAVARGFGWSEAEKGQGGVAASISTGMIGQGVVNFGEFFGPIAAALLMAVWVAVLARQDLLGFETPRLLLYALGIVLTFNMGRDITLLVIYPFIFGYILFGIWKKMSGSSLTTDIRD
jgi:hypothetical protein